MAEPNVKCGWLDRGTKYTKSWTKRFVTLDRPARCLKYAENDKKAPKGTILMKKIMRTVSSPSRLPLLLLQLYFEVRFLQE